MKLEKRIEVSELLATYGSLLTEYQLEILFLRYEDDWTLAEIANEFNVTRQAVLKAENAAIKQLREYENNLGILSCEREIKEILNRIHDRSIRLEILSALQRVG